MDCFIWIINGENIDGWHLDNICWLYMRLLDIEREKFDELPAKRQIHQYFPPLI